MSILSPRKWLLASSVLTGMMMTAPALAQEVSTETTTTTTTEEEVVTEVVITGSRIKGKEFTSASPVTIITAEKSTAAGLISAAEVLQGSSVANGSGQINSTFTGYVLDGGGGINTISLRGLGAQRSLVLLNGRRMPPAGVSGTVAAVDLNTLPDAVVSRYEILKDGASSIYGSDAVAGVVNVITRSNFEGLEFNATARVPEAGAGETYDFSGIWGKRVDKGHFLVSGSYSETKAVTQGDRKGFDCAEEYLYNEDGTRADLVSNLTGEYACWGSTTGGILIDDTYFRIPRDGSSAFGVPGWFGPVPFADRQLDPAIEDRVTVFSPVKRYTFFAQGEYRPEWAGGAELYTELLVNRRESEQHGIRYIFPYYDPQSPQNPFGTGSAYDIADGPARFGAYVYPYFLTKSDDSQEVDVYRGVFGARGDYKGWAWDSYLSYSKSKGEYTGDVVPKDRLFYGTGLNEDTFEFIGVCPPEAPAGCVPLNLLTPAALNDGVLTQAERDYFFLTETGKTEYEQTIFEASTTGDLFDLPAGPLGAAFGIAIRKDKINDVPGEYSRAANAWGSASAGITKGEDTLSEAYFELEAPIVNGKTFFEDLKLNFSGRYSNYDSVGDAFTYKVGLNWAIDNTFRFRATHGTSFRAPALYEMFLNAQTAYLSQRTVDPCINWGATNESGQLVKSQTIRDNCAAEGIPATYNGNGPSTLIEYSGSTSLNPEESTATNFGFALTPPDTGFKMAIDFWRIEVEDQILSTGAGVVGACYGQETYPNNGFCGLFTRDPSTNYITFIDASYRNIPSEETSGVDFTASYEKEFNFGTLAIDLDATFTKDSKTQLFPGDVVLDYNGTIADPKMVGDIQTSFKHKDWTFYWTLNYVGESTNQGYREEDGVVNLSYAPLAYNKNFTNDWTTHDVTVRYQAKTWTVNAGVINIADEEAPIISYGDNTGSPGRLGIYAWGSQYRSGYLGRQFYLRMSKSF
ncbi:TonB-dependent receptor domain-containing protein [Asticcacaulis endophyticus]|uniref:TonB-dependent receptor n=1 Tax=Asticcacaulis endophyticus TaxID=1395890 RepID=A0A918QC13_9CAUL|nr:TonB-dependent receptor [Asticcacaulis endophyticus]GGZ41445.1 TonB-dependent receptor [Asticcacaulis endophyticus]